MPSNLCHPLLLLCRPLFLLPSILPSIRVFSNESVLHIRWPKYWSFSFSISPCNEYSGLMSFRMDWLDLFVVQGTLNSLLQHHSSKASIIQCSAFFIVQLSNPYMTTGKIIALTRRTLFEKVYASSSPVFLMMYSAYKINKQGDNIQPWRTPFPIWNQSVVPCPKAIFNRPFLNIHYGLNMEQQFKP